MAELLNPQINFAPLGQLGQVYQAAQQQQQRRVALAALGQNPGDTSPLYASGDMSLANLGVQMDRNRVLDGRDTRDYTRQISRDAATDKYQSASLDLQRRAAERQDKTLENRDPEQTAAQRAKIVRTYGLDPATPQGRSFILTGELPSATNDFSAQVEQRKTQAIANGLDPSSPGFQSYVLTGKMPREDAQPLTATDKKAILEADEGVMAAKAAVDSLGRAKQLSMQAFAGPLASQRGYAASFLGNSSDLGKAGIATSELDNEITSNALTQLKAIFGGAPTEGERKILLDIQGASRLPNDVRQKIYDRAQQMAQVRLKFNEQRASEMRGGQFYKPQGSMTRAPVAQSQGITQDQYAALPSGSTFTAPDGTQRVKP